jgi:hypothetical protein
MVDPLEAPNIPRPRDPLPLTRAEILTDTTTAATTTDGATGAAPVRVAPLVLRNRSFRDILRSALELEVVEAAKVAPLAAAAATIVDGSGQAATSAEAKPPLAAAAAPAPAAVTCCRWYNVTSLPRSVVPHPQEQNRNKSHAGTVLDGLNVFAPLKHLVIRQVATALAGRGWRGWVQAPVRQPLAQHDFPALGGETKKGPTPTAATTTTTTAAGSAAAPAAAKRLDVVDVVDTELPPVDEARLIEALRDRIGDDWKRQKKKGCLEPADLWRHYVEWDNIIFVAREKKL